ncbi:MAG: arabinofuranosidase catalytic domain-containing protein [Terracidiphilus sp.]|nr:arabinofuranosidase catalytic domain-containing protein [Terracidiphilus sp.]
MKKTLRIILGIMLAGAISHARPVQAEAGTGPCDILATAGTPCIAAHSLARRMLASYAGPLFQITRASDSRTLDISTLSSGAVNAASITSFCSGTTCTITIIYDQMGTLALGNNLLKDGAFGKVPASVGWTTLPNGMTIPIARIVSGEGYYQGKCCNPGTSGTVGMPTGNNAITAYMVSENYSEGGQVSGCCGTYGDTESPTRNAGKGAMFSLAYATGNLGTFGTGTGPWPGVDLENGVFLYGSTPTQNYLSIFGRYNPAGSMFTVKSGDATQGRLATLYNGPLPAGYTMDLEGGLSLGRGGDGSNAPTNFIEGAIVASATTDATDNAVQANLTSFYGLAGSVTSNATLAITSANPLPSGVSGTAYSQTLTASGGSGTGLSWTVTSGGSILTEVGLSLSSGGVLSGSSQTAGSASFAVEVTDSASNTATASFSVNMNNAPGDTFTVAGAAVSVAPGATTGNTSTITVTPGSGGFLGTVSLTCSVSPTASNDQATCSLSPASVNLSGTTAQTSTLTIGTTAATAGLVDPRLGNRKGWLGAGSGAVLALLVFFGIPGRRRSWRAMLSILVAMSALGALASCGGSGRSGGGGGGSAGTTAGTYTVTVTGTSGATIASGTVTLTVQ